ncbi:MAG: 4Fe-4S cluster-binding domain-containing protein [Erysipelotrichaceae bacterium]|nr:4Fe-4S cluster-binding domain-containing protein [Erysipelotrichaceae bacterium]
MMNKSKKRKQRSVTIVLTEACNLRCTYCYESFKTPHKMTLEMAKSIVDKEMANSQNYDYIQFDLFGGEPFLAFDVIKPLVEYAEEKGYTKKCFFFPTSNGTLIHGEIQDWLVAHKDSIWVGLSLDGTKEMHDTNRDNSFDLIDLDFFAKNYPTQDIKMTISKESLPHLAEGVIFCHDKGFGVSCNLAYNIDWSDKENEEILKRELSKLIDFYLEHPNYNPCSILAGSILGVVRDESKPLKRQCGSGLTMVAYEIDGKRYPCQFFMPTSIGKEKAREIGKIDLPEFTTDDMLDKKCRNCVAKQICMICYGANYAATGSPFSRDENTCELNKIIFKARSYFYAMQWKKGYLKDMPKRELNRLLKAIKIIQTEL